MIYKEITIPGRVCWSNERPSLRHTVTINIHLLHLLFHENATKIRLSSRRKIHREIPRKIIQRQRGFVIIWGSQPVTLGGGFSPLPPRHRADAPADEDQTQTPRRHETDIPKDSCRRGGGLRFRQWNCKSSSAEADAVRSATPWPPSDSVRLPHGCRSRALFSYSLFMLKSVSTRLLLACRFITRAIFCLLTRAYVERKIKEIGFSRS